MVHGEGGTRRTAAVRGSVPITTLQAINLGCARDDVRTPYPCGDALGGDYSELSGRLGNRKKILHSAVIEASVFLRSYVPVSTARKAPCTYTNV